MSRRAIVIGLILVAATAFAVRGALQLRAGRVPEAIWGQWGVMPGDIVRPRAATVDHNGDIYLVDFTARIQRYHVDGTYAGVTWQTPDYRNGRPSGLGTDRDGNILVCDSHYHCVRTYTPEGQLLRTLGGEAGTGVRPFGYVSDCIQDADGFYYLAEFGQNDRITKLDAEGRFVCTWGTSGIEPGQFQRLRSLAIGPDDLIYAADACNHRIQVFTKAGEFVRTFGGPGSGLGEFSYPFDLCFNAKGDLYVVERGNRRVQKLTKEGRALGTWGSPGSGPGQFADPWALVVDKNGKVQVVDTENHRVQRIDF
jgi:DNA-binding beta-propeller fold protein YncE